MSPGDGCNLPVTLWSLHGLAECLERIDKGGEAKKVRKKLDPACARSDVDIKASREPEHKPLPTRLLAYFLPVFFIFIDSLGKPS